MTREEVKKILGENATEEQITNTLNALHNQSNALKSVNFCCINDEEKKADVSLENGQLVIIQNENYNIIKTKMKLFKFK